jgi:hypothetical protein
VSNKKRKNSKTKRNEKNKGARIETKRKKIAGFEKETNRNGKNRKSSKKKPNETKKNPFKPLFG